MAKTRVSRKKVSRKKVSRKKVSRSRMFRGLVMRGGNATKVTMVVTPTAEAINSLTASAADTTLLQSRLRASSARVPDPQTVSAANARLVANALSASSARVPRVFTGSLIANDTTGSFFPLGKYKLISGVGNPSLTPGKAMTGNRAVSGNWLSYLGATANGTYLNFEFANKDIENNDVWPTFTAIATAKGSGVMTTASSNPALGSPCFYIKFTNTAGTSEVVIRNAYVRSMNTTKFVIVARYNLKPPGATTLPSHGGLHSYIGSPNTSDTYTLSVAVSTPYVAPKRAQ